MKNLLKKVCAVSLAAIMTVSASAVFAAQTENSFIITHIEWIEGSSNGEATLTAKAFIRNYDEVPENAMLVCGVYDASGALVDAGAAQQANGNARATVTKPAEGQTAKAFLWNANGQAPVKEIATYGASLNNIDLDIKLDGKSISEYTGGKVTFSKDTPEYNITLAENSTTKVIQAPTVTGTASDSSISVLVSNVSETETKVSFKNSAKNESKEYTINWAVPTDIVTEGQFEDSSSNIVGMDSTTAFVKKYSHSYTVEPGNTKEISMTIDFHAAQTGIIIVVPEDSTNGADIIAGNDTYNQWSEDPLVIADYNYETKTPTYGEMMGAYSLFNGKIEHYNPGKGPVTLSGFSVTSVPVYRRTQNSDDGQITGIRVSATHVPVFGQTEITGFPDDLLGCNYIALPSAGVANAGVTFTITGSATVVYLGGNGVKVTDSDGNTYVGESVTGVTKRYMNAPTAVNQAYALGFGYATEDDIREVTTYQTFYALTWRAVHNMVNAGINKWKTPKAGTYAASLSGRDAIVSACRTIGSAKPLITDLQFAEGITTGNNENGTYGGTLTIGKFDVDQNFLTDRPATITDIPAGLELDGAEFILGWQELGNGKDNSILTQTGRALYSFTVSKDAEVYVIYAGGSYDASQIHILSDGMGVGGMWYSTDANTDHIATTLGVNGAYNIKEIGKYSAGSTVTIQANGMRNAKILTVVKPIK